MGNLPHFAVGVFFDSSCPSCERLYWVGTGRVALRYVSPCPPLDPYVRLSPHTAHDRGILWEMSISPAPWCLPHGQLTRSLGTFVLFPDPLPQALRRVRSFPTLRLDRKSTRLNSSHTATSR